jgi:serine/threonine-protein kinase
MSVQDNALPEKIGPYQVEKQIAVGGMGEIYLVYDSSCSRKIALKKIRTDRLKYPTLQERFLREAKIASQMTHPSIIPIYNIHAESAEIYYTMPYVEGETLKQILRQSLQEEINGKILHPIGSSISSLMRIFLNISQAIAYCHNRGVLHRDIKPENIMVGKFGETFILDWGLADFINNPTPDDSQEHFSSIECIDLTKPGKIPGTLAYIAPERVFGEASTPASDIYALGVILYQLLTLRLPFQRTSHKKIKQQIQSEELIEPHIKSPYRDIPFELSRIAMKCLSPQPHGRYSNMQDLLFDIENYIEGKGLWTLSAPLDIANKSDWEFQASILQAKHLALTRTPGMMEWVNLMVSKNGFPGNCKIETSVQLSPSSLGIGFLLNIPEAGERKGLFEDGHALWIGSKIHPGCHLSRSNLQILAAPEITLEPNRFYKIRIERVDCHLRVFLDEKMILDYLTQIPLTGPHFGIILKDEDLKIDSIEVFTSSPTIMVNCMKVPDTFLSNKYYSKALGEYRKISNSFPGRKEGREALFRAGITLVEEAIDCRSNKKKSLLLQQALDEFGKLRKTPGAPLEYVGKSLVYKASGEIEEEIKCLDLSLRKYHNHPLKYLIEEETIFRLHQAAYQNRTAAYELMLLALRHIPSVFEQPQHKALLDSLQRTWQALPFFEESKDLTSAEELSAITIRLAFFLGKPLVILEILKSLSPPPLIGNALFALIKLGVGVMAEEHLEMIIADSERADPLRILIQYQKNELPISPALEGMCATLSFSSIRASCFLMEEELFKEKNKIDFSKINQICMASPSFTITQLMAKLLDPKKHGVIDPSLRTQDLSLEWQHFFDGCKIAQSEGENAALTYLLEYPSFFFFQSVYVENEGAFNNKLAGQLLYFEKLECLRLSILFTYCCANQKATKKLKNLLKKQRQYVQRISSSA